jgi:hypothetical protein
VPVEKTEISKLVQEGGTFCVIPSDTIRAIEGPDSLAILVFLLDKPTNWIVRRTHIMERFSLGRIRYDKAIRELRIKGLMWSTPIIDAQGAFSGSTIHITSKIPHSPVNTPADGLPTTPETGSLPKSDHLNKTDTIKHDISSCTPPISVPGPRKLPEDWHPAPGTIQRLIDLEIKLANPQYTLNEFKDYWHANKKRKADWEATFLNRAKQQAQYEKKTGVNNGRTTNSTELLASNLDDAIQSDAQAGW